MEIYVTKNGEQLGPFSRQDAVSRLKDGTLAYGDLAWHAEDPAWKPLAEVLLIDTSAAPSWGEIAASLPEPKRAQERPAAARVVVKSGGGSSWGYAVALLLICGAGFYIYTRKAPSPDTATTPARTPSMSLSEIFLEDDVPVRTKPGQPKKSKRPAESRARPPEAVPEELALNSERSPFDESVAPALDPVPAPPSDVPPEFANRPGLAGQSAPPPQEHVAPIPAVPETAPTPPEVVRTPGISGLEKPARPPIVEVTPDPAPVPGPPRRHSISLRVKASTAASGSTRTVGYYTANRTYAREQNITITVHNLSHDADQVELEWYFVGRPAGSGSTRRFIYDKGSQAGVEVKAGGWKEVEAVAKELQHSSYTGYSSRYAYGDKPDGWIVFAKADGQVIDIEASSSTLEGVAKNPAEFKKLLGEVE